MSAWTKPNSTQGDFDLIITNQLLASMDIGDSITASVRGGISTGVTSPSKGPYGGASVFSTFPILSDLPYFANEKGRNYSRDMGILIAGAYVTHELGHLIMHDNHPTGHKGCILKSASGLHYLDWYEQLTENKPCRRKHPKLDHF